MPVTCVLFLSLALSTAGAAQAPEISIETTKQVRICDCAERDTRFRVTIPDLKKTRVLMDRQAPAVREVIRGEALENARAGDFTFTWDIRANTAPALVLHVADSLREPGTYEIVVDLLPASPRPIPPEHIKIIVPSASLEAPGKLLAERTVYAPAWLAHVWADEKLPLAIREKGQQAGIQALNGRTGPLAVDTKQIPGSVRLSGPVRVKQGDWTFIDAYSLDGVFPPGTATGRLFLTAQELTEPLAVDVEVRSRVSKWYLLVAILLGLLASLLTKVKLAQYIALRQARVLAAKLLEDVQRDLGRYTEAAFADKVRVDRESLDRARTGSDPRSIESARAALDTVWKSAVQEAEGRRADYRTKAARFAELVSMDWPLPVPLRGPLDAARDAAKTAKASQAPDVTDRFKVLEGAQGPFMKAMQTVGEVWRRTVVDLFGYAVGQRDGLPDALITTLEAAASAWPTAYPPASPLPAPFDPAQIEPALRNLAGQYLAAKDAVALIESRLHRALVEVAGELDTTPASGLSNASARTADVVRTATNAVEDPDVQRDNFLGALTELQLAWQQDIGAHFASDPQDVQDAVADDVRAQMFRKAAARKRQGARLRSVGDVPLSLPASLDRLSLPNIPGLSPSAIVEWLARGTASPYVTLLIASADQLRRAKALQTAIVLLLFLAWALSSFGAKWDGTWAGLFAVFVGAFSIDVAVDTLLGKVTPA
jgi:hypothetical protein